MAKQTIRGKHNLQIGGDFVVNINRAIEDIHNTEDLDQAIVRVGRILEGIHRRHNNYDGTRLLILFLCLFLSASVVFTPELHRIWIYVPFASIILTLCYWLGHVRMRLGETNIQILACKEVLSMLWQQKILWQGMSSQQQNPGTIPKTNIPPGTSFTAPLFTRPARISGCVI